MSAQVLGNGSLSKFDVLVIGSGVGGGTVADVLTRAGQKVLMLECGSNYFQGIDDPDPAKPVPLYSNDELKIQIRNFIDPVPLVEPRSFRTSPSDGERSFVGDVNGLPKTVGGGTVHADLKLIRFRPTDFQLGTLLAGQFPGTSFADWPVSYDQLEPFYGWAEQAMGVQGEAGADPIEPPRSAPYPMPPGQPMYAGLLAKQGGAKLGVTVFPYPSGVNSRPYGGRPPCIDCGFCDEYGCPVNAKGSPAVTTLRRALLSGNLQLWTQTKAVRLVVDGSGTQVTGVQAIGWDGAPLSFTADRYLLAASPIEDARLLYLSGSGDALGNSSGQVGRNLTFHLETDVAGIFEQRLHTWRGRSTSHAITDFRGAPNDPNHPLCGVVEIGGPIGPLTEAQVYAAIPFDALGTRLEALIRQSPLRDRVLGFTMHGEDAPQPTNRVDLDPALRDLDGVPVPRVTYQNHAFELSARAFYLPKLLDLLGAAGAKYSLVSPVDQIPSSAHIMGTLRFGDDPRTSVCDQAGRFHDIGNLYAADGCLFPTSSGFNPSLTIAALAAYVAASLVNPTSPTAALGS